MVKRKDAFATPPSASPECLELSSASPSLEVPSSPLLSSPEQSPWRARVEASLERAKRVARRLGLHHVFHEVRIFVETENEALLRALLAQAEIFRERAQEEARGAAPELLDTIASLQRRLRIKSHALHQLPCTPATTVRRAELIRQYARPESRILCLGDDDFVSVALAWFLPNDITVLDIDPQVLSLIAAVAAERRLRITCRRADIRHPLPEDMKGAYDIVITDPIYAVSDMVLFLTAAEACLRKASTSYLFTGGSHALLGRSWAQIESWARAHRLHLHAFLPGFNAYPKTKRLQLFLTLAERLLLRSPLTRACVRLPYVYSDYIIWQHEENG